jgi:pimeloyl-ACP methyl ester carboxylesterase
MKTLVMIPALGCDAGLYAQVSACLPDVIGTVVTPVSEPSLESCVAAVLDAVAGEFVVLGTSFGGRVAMEVALAAPERVKGLVVIGAGAGPAADPAAGLRRSARLRGGELEEVTAEMAAIVAHLPGPNGAATRDAFSAMMRRQGAEFIARQSDALAHRADLWPRLAEIKCPALMLWGKHDQFSPAADGLRMASLLPKGRYVELAECGHFPSLEYPEETAAALMHWLADSRLI